MSLNWLLNTLHYGKLTIVLFDIFRFVCFVNPFPHIGAFWCLCSRQLLKTLWQMEKLFIMCNFFFCHNVFRSCLLQLHQNASTSLIFLNVSWGIRFSTFVTYFNFIVNYSLIPQRVVMLIGTSSAPICYCYIEKMITWGQREKYLS